MLDHMYIDCESCGFHGMPVIIQYAVNDGPIVIYEIWREPFRKTLELIQEICKYEVVGFNMAFDWFQIQKLQNVFAAYVAKYPDRIDNIPRYEIDDIADVEMDARDGMCVKPASCLDLMLHFRKTELQVTMERDDIRIRRVPKALAPELAKLLTHKIQLDPILFANQKKFAPRFKVFPMKDEDGEEHRTLCNVVLKFYPGGSLKALTTHVLGKKVTHFGEIDVDKKLRPKEYGFAPFARSVGKRGKWNWSWPDVIKFHIDHWAYREDARKYAMADVENTRDLHRYAGLIKGGDHDSILACCVASCRWKGYRIDPAKLDKLIETYQAKLQAPMAPSHVKKWINEVLNPIEQAIAWANGTDKKALKHLSELWAEHNPEAARRAKAVLEARKAKMKLIVLKKLKHAGRFHASFKVIGALSGRMSGADQLNAQGIDKTKEVRGCFPLCFEDEILLGGDMKSFEISIAAADYNDPKLSELLTTCEECDTRVVVEDGVLRCPSCISRYSGLHNAQERCCKRCGLANAYNEKDEPRCNRCDGAECKSFHALFGMGFFPEMTYKEIRQSAGLLVGNVYNPCKNGAFATMYGAQPAKLADTIGVSEEVAEEGFHKFWRTFEEAGKKRREIEYSFTSLYSEEGSQKIKYKVPEDSIESLLGYRRFFVLENYLIRAIWEVAENLPKEWKKLKVKVTRSSKRGEQTVGSAIRSALYGCAFGLQASCTRQAQNHRIQATGSGVTKVVQVAIWTIQPVGVHKWLVRPLNVHDELQSPTDPAMKEIVKEKVYAAVETFRSLIPLIGIDFGQLNSWADK